MPNSDNLVLSSFYEDKAIFPIGKILERPARIFPIPLTSLIFIVCTGIVIFFDSLWMTHITSYGQLMAMIVATLYLAWLLFIVDIKWLLPSLLFIPFSYLGEVLFSLVLGYYHYRLGFVPAYVPIGHAILMCVAAMIMATIKQLRKQRLWIYWLTMVQIGAVAIALFAFKDIFSFVYATLFFILTPYNKRFTLFALLIGLLVLYVEVMGTWLGSWHWAEFPGGILHTVNPPVGAFVFYVIGKVIAIGFAERSGLMKGVSQPFY